MERMKESMQMYMEHKKEKKKNACNAKQNVKNYKNKKQSKVGEKYTTQFPPEGKGEAKQERERGREGMR